MPKVGSKKRKMRRLFDVIYKNGWVTTAEAATKCNITPSYVSMLAEELISLGFIKKNRGFSPLRLCIVQGQGTDVVGALGKPDGRFNPLLTRNGGDNSMAPEGPEGTKRGRPKKPPAAKVEKPVVPTVTDTAWSKRAVQLEKWAADALEEGHSDLYRIFRNAATEVVAYVEG